MIKSMPTVYFSLHTQFPNLGDCVINELLLRELAKSSRIKITHRCAPKWLLDRLTQVPGIEVVTSKSAWFAGMVGNLVRRQPVAFVFKPGHHWISSRPKSLVYSLALILFCGLIRLMGGRVIRFGISLSPMQGLQQKSQTWLGRLHHRFGLRDQTSLEYARQLGIASAVYTPDMAFLLADGWPGCDSVGAQRMTQPEMRPHLAVSFRDNGPLPDAEFRQRLCDNVLRLGGQIKAHPTVVEQVTFDHQIARDLAARLNSSCISFEEDAASMCAIFDHYRSSRLVISNRLHSLLFAWSAGCIPVPMIENSQHSKIGDLFRHLGLADLLMHWENMDQLTSHCTRLLDDEATLRLRLREIMQQQQNALQHVIAHGMD